MLTGAHQDRKRRLVNTVAIISLLLLGAYLRLKGLGDEPFWMDEGYTMAYTELPFFKMLEYIATRDVHPPLYYIIIKLWRIFGNSEFYLRFPSVLFGLGAIWEVWTGVYENWGMKNAFSSALLIATSEAAIWYSQEVRMYSLLLLLTAISIKYFLRIVSPKGEQHTRDVVILAISNIGLLYTHNVAVFLWLSQLIIGVIWGAILWIRKRDDARVVRPWVIGQVATGLAYLPWFIILLQQRGNVADRFWVGMPDRNTISSIFSIALAWKAQPSSFLVPLTWAAVGLVIVKTLFKYRDTRYWALIVMTLVPIMVSYLYSVFVTPMMVDRTLLFVCIPIFILLGSGSPLVVSIISIIVVAGLTFTNIEAWSVESTTQTKEDFRTAAVNAQRYADKSTAFVFNNVASQSAFDFYFHKYRGHKVVDEYGVPCHYLQVPLGNANLEPLVTNTSVYELSRKLWDKDRVLLIMSHQYYTDPSGLVLSYLSSNWRYQESTSVNGVELHLFSR